jgi:hypothetical protein
MIFGAEGLIGLVNILLLVGLVGLVVLALIYRRYRKFKAQHRVSRTTKITLTISALVAAPFALLALTILIFAGYAWASERPARIEFERNNQNSLAVTKAMQNDDVEAFRKAIDQCGGYCARPEKGKKKFDNLIVFAGHRDATNIQALLERWNEKEQIAPYSERELQNQRAARCISQRLARIEGDPKPDCDEKIQWLTIEADKYNICPRLQLLLCPCIFL